MRSRMSTSLQVAAFVILLVCLVDCMSVNSNTPSRVKRGFRSNVGDRMAHGFGKRGYSSHVTDQEVEDGTRWLDDDSLETSISSAADFTRLLVSNPALARVIVAKFIDVNGDDDITSAELFRRVK